MIERSCRDEDKDRDRERTGRCKFGKEKNCHLLVDGVSLILLETFVLVSQFERGDQLN